MTTRQEPMPGTQAIRRAVAVLEAFGDDRPAWSVSELATAVGLNRTTVYRLLTALESVEYVDRDAAADTYRLGSGLIALGARAQRANPVRLRARPELEALAAGTGETATLELLSGYEVVILDEIPGEYVTSGSQHIGSRWPVYATSTGKAILAHLPPEELARVLVEPFRRLTAHTLIDVAQLRACLAEQRRAGYAVAVEELEVGFVAVGAPLLDARGYPVAAISLGGTRARLTDERVPAIGSLVRAAAGRISHQLGYRPDSPAGPGDAVA
ncbi:MAG: IclR family transcriptional regulator [Anaerolineae bacterium]|nr:IclR family transcriptional regulator [Anaerolineae bacterium]